MNIIQDQLLFQESQLVSRETFTLKLLDALKAEPFTKVEQFFETNVSFDDDVSSNLLSSSANLFEDLFFEVLDSMSFQELREMFSVDDLSNLQ